MPLDASPTTDGAAAAPSPDAASAPSPPRRWGLSSALPWLAVGLLVWWLFFTEDVERHDLGPGDALIARVGAGAFLVQTGAADRPGQGPETVWMLFPADATSAADGAPVPSADGAPVLGHGTLAYALRDGGLFVHIAGEAEGRGPLAGIELSAGARLEDVLVLHTADGASRDLPLVSHPVGGEPEDGAPGEAVEGGRALSWIDLAAGHAGEEAVRPLRTEDGVEARVPAGEVVSVSRFGPSVAFRGDAGWEAWTLRGSVEAADRRLAIPERDLVVEIAEAGPLPLDAVRVSADDHVGTACAFAPDADGLVIEGRRDGGLWRLDLLTGGMSFMAEGNMGQARRVAPGAGTRADPPRLVNGQWGRDGVLQIFETHFSGGGRAPFKVSFRHAYGVAVGPAGRLIAYATAKFDDGGDDPFEEDLYLFDYEHPSRNAVHLGSRPGGRAGAGPAFVGADAPGCVFLAEGRAWLVRFSEPSSSP